MIDRCRYAPPFRLAAAVVIATATATACTDGPRGDDPMSVARLDGSRMDSAALTREIEALRVAANVHGLTVTIFNDAAPVYSRAFGTANANDARPLRTSTELYGASLSKVVFAVLVMKLVEQGLIDLDKPLQDHVAEPLWQNKATTWHEDLSALRDEPRHRRITPRMALSHTTGLPNWRWFEPDQKLRIHFEPGARYSYSGEGMTLLQVVVEKVAGKPLETLMQEQVFGPYGMTMSSYRWQPRFEGDYAVGHATDGKTYPKDKDNDPRAPSTLETTTEDYARFMAAVLGREGLSEASWDELFEPQIRIRSTGMIALDTFETTDANDAIELSSVLGWGLQRTPHGWGAFKEGDGSGFIHYSIVYPDQRIGVLLLTNSDNARGLMPHLLRLTIADSFTPLEFENYVPFDSLPPMGAVVRAP